MNELTDEIIDELARRMAELDETAAAARRETARLRRGLFSCIAAAIVLAIGCYWLDVHSYTPVALNVAFGLGVLVTLGGWGAIVLHSQAHERMRRAAAEKQALMIYAGEKNG